MVADTFVVKMKTAFIYDPLFLSHNTGTGHPESSARLRVSFDLIKSRSWYSDLYPLAARPADSKWIDRVHHSRYEGRIKLACSSGQRYIDTPDVTVSQDSYDVARKAAGGLLEIADHLMTGEIDNGFAMTRPPGHHAEANYAMGFCLFNNVAIAARYLQERYQLERILIMDWDVHHGNGTQHIFEEDPTVFYVSLHQFPHYPGTGARAEAGRGKGEGTTLNCPMNPGSGDELYRQAFKEIIMPKALDFRPDAVLISAGFDAHRADPLGAINLDTASYIWMTDDDGVGGQVLSRQTHFRS